MIDEHIIKALNLHDTINAKAEQLEQLIIAAREQEDVLLTPKQVTDLLILIGELTLVNSGMTSATLESNSILF